MRTLSPSPSMLAILLTIALLLVGCSSAEQDQASPQPPSIGSVVFDMGHGEVFGAGDTTELGQSQAIGRMRAAGFEVTVNNDTITPEDLANASGLVLAGPMVPLRDEEYATITSFVERGGTVLLTIHVPFPVLAVPAHWGLPVGTSIVMSEEPYANPAEPSVFLADAVAGGPVTEGVSELLVISGWPVATATDAASLAISTGPDCWLSQVGDQQPQRPAGTELASYGVIGVTQLGEGHIIVCGDDAIFANLAINEADNARLLDNIIQMMSEMTEA